MTFFPKDKIFTHVLTNSSVTFNADDGIKSVALKLVSGAGFFQGTKAVGTLSSAPIPLAVNDPVTISDDNVISNLIVDCTGGGVIYIIARS